MAATKTLTAEVPESLASRVDTIASQFKRSPDWVVQQALTAWVDLEEERHRLTLEALADVDAGRTVDHARVKAWAESLATDNPLPLPQPLPRA